MQRSRLRRNQAVRKRSRVTSIKDLAQWQKLVNKLGDKLLVAHFFAVSESITVLMILWKHWFEGLLCSNERQSMQSNLRS